jgi:hypothetical protein
MIDPTTKELDVAGGTGPGEISSLHVQFIVPDAGAFGRDKTVPMSEATRAKISYLKDGQRIEDQIVMVSEAATLVDTARADEQAMLARLEEKKRKRIAQQEEIRQKVENLSCTVCDGRDFDEQTSREDSQFGMTTFRMRLLICKQCGFVMQFSLGRSLFVPGGNNSALRMTPGAPGSPLT